MYWLNGIVIASKSLSLQCKRYKKGILYVYPYLLLKMLALEI